MTYSIPTTFIGRAYTTSIPTTVVGMDIPTKLVGTVYFDKSCNMHGKDAMPLATWSSIQFTFYTRSKT